MQSGIIIFFMEELFDEMHNELSLVPQKSGHVTCAAKKRGRLRFNPIFLFRLPSKVKRFFSGIKWNVAILHLSNSFDLNLKLSGFFRIDQNWPTIKTFWIWLNKLSLVQPRQNSGVLNFIVIYWTLFYLTKPCWTLINLVSIRFPYWTLEIIVKPCLTLFNLFRPNPTLPNLSLYQTLSDHMKMRKINRNQDMLETFPINYMNDKLFLSFFVSFYHCFLQRWKKGLAHSPGYKSHTSNGDRWQREIPKMDEPRLFFLTRHASTSYTRWLVGSMVPSFSHTSKSLSEILIPIAVCWNLKTPFYKVKKSAKLPSWMHLRKLQVSSNCTGDSFISF